MNSPPLTKISNCEVCQNPLLDDVLDLGLHPLCDDLKPIGFQDASDEYPIEISHCKTCHTSHQKFQIDKTILFPRSYHYRSSLTQDVIYGLNQLVDDHIKNFGPVQDLKVLDVGCNDGALLDIFSAKGAITHGIDPTNAIDDAENKHKCIKAYFNQDSASLLESNFGKFDIVTFTNVFAHISDINELFESLKLVIHSDTLIIIENHYLLSILDSNQFDTFYHEHPRTYSLKSFSFIAQRLNLKISSFSFPSRYGGNVRITLSRHENADKDSLDSAISKEDEMILSGYNKMNEFILNWKESKHDELSYLCNKYNVAGKAFPGRAAILIKLLNLNEGTIEKVFEKPSSPKIGNYIPGTRIGIYSDYELFKSDNKYDYIINFAWHIKNEVTNYLKDNKIDSKVIHIL